MAFVQLKQAGYAHFHPEQHRHDRLTEIHDKLLQDHTESDLCWWPIAKTLLAISRLHARKSRTGPVYKADYDWVRSQMNDPSLLDRRAGPARKSRAPRSVAPSASPAPFST